MIQPSLAAIQTVDIRPGPVWRILWISAFLFLSGFFLLAAIFVKSFADKVVTIGLSAVLGFIALKYLVLAFRRLPYYRISAEGFEDFHSRPFGSQPFFIPWNNIGSIATTPGGIGFRRNIAFYADFGCGKEIYRIPTGSLGMNTDKLCLGIDNYRLSILQK